MRFPILRVPFYELKMSSRHQSIYRTCGVRVPTHYFHTTSGRKAIKPYLLADIGEGITECRVVQWFVKPGDKVNQFDSICEVQSDKASVEITSRYEGVITSIHHEVDAMAEVGKPLLDIDVEDDSSITSQGIPKPNAEQTASRDKITARSDDVQAPANEYIAAQLPTKNNGTGSKNSGLMVPAVRAMLKQHKIDLKDVKGTGKGGRLSKEDVQHFLAKSPLHSNPASHSDTISGDEIVSLSPIETQMFKVMTRSLSIPQFGYSHSVDFTSLNDLRHKFNRQAEASGELHGSNVPRLTPLPIALKALSQAFLRYPRMNALLDAETDPSKPRLIVKASHNFGIAVDTPNGLLVPVIKDVQDRSILSIAAEVKRLSSLAIEGRLSSSDMSGATFVVSNIGSIGGSVVNPIIMPPTVAIVALGQIEEVPVFLKGNSSCDTSIIKRKKAVLSWSGDHRVLDGASVARCAELVARLLENIDTIAIALR